MSHDFKTENAMELNFNEHRQSTHGDVVIEQLSSVPKGFNKLASAKEPVLAYGEVTGHSHKMFRIPDQEGAVETKIDLRIGENGIQFLRLDGPVVLRHQEHDPRIIPAGDYKIQIQREYDPFTKLVRSVAD